MDIGNDTDRIQPEIEPLSEQAWQRVEARIFERLTDGPPRAASDAARRQPAARRKAPPASGQWVRGAPWA